MTHKTLLLSFSLFLSATTALSQSQGTNQDELPYIELIGSAEKEVIPDEIYLGIILHERFVNKEKISIEEQEDKLKTALKGLGIDLKNLYLSDANADYLKIRWQKKDVLTKKDYTLKVANATAVGLVFQELETLEIKDAFVSSVSHSKLDSLRREVKIMAIKTAKDKADYLLAAIGEQTGKPIIVKETDASSMANAPGLVTLRGSRSEPQYYFVDGIKVRDKDDEIQFQKIKLQSNIYVKFLIKQP